jgi:hypothetical protein
MVRNRSLSSEAELSCCALSRYLCEGAAFRIDRAWNIHIGRGFHNLVCKFASILNDRNPLVLSFNHDACNFRWFLRTLEWFVNSRLLNAFLFSCIRHGLSNSCVAQLLTRRKTIACTFFRYSWPSRYLHPFSHSYERKCNDLHFFLWRVILEEF